MSVPPKNLNASLPPELANIIASPVASGRCWSAGKAVQTALRLTERYEVDLLPEGLRSHPDSKSGQVADA